MSNKLTYIEARDKIWNAYFRDEIKPMNSSFCFCGNLLDKSPTWNWEARSSNKIFAGYSIPELKKMEMGLFDGMSDIDNVNGAESKKGDPFFEDALLNGMIRALEVLKQIHRGRGDFIPEDEPLLTKRNLEHA